MSIESRRDLDGLRAAGRVVAAAITAMRARVAPGVSTAALDRAGAREFSLAGARSGPQLAYDFPGVTCINVNDEAVHGIPGRRRLRAGDLVKLDVTAELHGYYADACVSVPVGEIDPARARLVAAGRDALARGMGVARTGTAISEVGGTVERTVRSHGHSVCRELTGHGIGRRIHEWPIVPNYDEPELSAPLTRGLVITIEPVISLGSGAVTHGRDGWTVRTADGACSAHVEHTIVVTDGAPIVITAA